MRATRLHEELVWETLNGLTAFLIPGPDPYSVPQGISTTEPGGIDAGITGLLVATCLSTPRSSASEPLACEAAAWLLNAVAERINPQASGQFASPFACLSFSEKVAVFAFLDEHLFSTCPYELASLKFLMQIVIAHSEVMTVASEPLALTERRPHWIILQNSGVC